MTRPKRGGAPKPKRAKKSDDDTIRTETPAGAREADGDEDVVETDAEPVDGEVLDTVGEVIDAADVKLPKAAPDKSASIARHDPFAAYMRDVTRYPLLTPDEEHALAVAYAEKGDVNAAARMVTANLRLVVKIAYEYRRAYRNLLDLVQEGNIGLMQAVRKYDPYKGVKLSSYAAWWIRAYMLRFILNNWRLVKLGTTQAQRKLFFNLNKEKARLSAMGIEPTSEEIAKRLDVSKEDVEQMDRRLSGSDVSLDVPVSEGEGRSVARIDLIPEKGGRIDDLLADEEVSQLLKDKVGEFGAALTGKDAIIFKERLVAEEPRTLQELGAQFGVSRERVRQLEKRLQDKLKKYLQSELGSSVLS